MIKNYFSHFSTKLYVVGTQKKRLNETVLLSTHNMLKLMSKEIFTILRSIMVIILNLYYLYMHLYCFVSVFLVASSTHM